MAQRANVDVRRCTFHTRVSVGLDMQAAESAENIESRMIGWDMSGNVELPINVPPG